MRQVMHPEGFHGHGRRGRFFEGWYHKLVGPDGRALALIPGWFQAADGARFGFLLIFDELTATVRTVRFDAADVRAEALTYDFRLGPNRFSADHLVLDIDTPEVTLKGEVRATELHPWPVTLGSPGVMGWYGWVPLMQCWHGVVSLDHRLHGTLVLDGVTRGFDGGRGYTEKDWGWSFPDAWVWMQANAAGTSLTASVATIPWLAGTSFAGFIVGMLHDGVLHRFTTYARGRIEALEVTDADVRWTLRNRTHRLELHAVRGGVTVLLPAPDVHDMVPKVPESLGVQITARLSTLAGEELVALRSPSGALEVMGDTQRLRQLLGR